jgi:hypothetical protein
VELAIGHWKPGENFSGFEKPTPKTDYKNKTTLATQTPASSIYSDSMDDEDYEVEKILGHRGGKEDLYLVRWAGYGPDDDQWISADAFISPKLIEEYHRIHPKWVSSTHPDSIGNEGVYDVEEILDHKISYHGGKEEDLYLVQWAGYGSDDIQWILADAFISPELIEEYHQTYPQRKRRRSNKRTSTD